MTSATFTAWGGADPNDAAFRLLIASCVNVSNLPALQRCFPSLYSSSLAATKPVLPSLHRLIVSLHKLHVSVSTDGRDERIVALRNAVHQYHVAFKQRFPKLALLVATITQPWQRLACISTMEQLSASVAAIEQTMLSLQRECDEALEPKEEKQDALLDSQQCNDTVAATAAAAATVSV